MNAWAYEWLQHILCLFLIQTKNGDKGCEQSGEGGLQADNGETGGA